MDEDELHFSWNPDKAAKSLVPFEYATNVFDDPHRLEMDDEFAEGEYRTIVIGKVDTVLLTVVYAEPEENHYRIISARLATPTERKTYENDLFQS